MGYWWPTVDREDSEEDRKRVVAARAADAAHYAALRVAAAAERAAEALSVPIVDDAAEIVVLTTQRARRRYAFERIAEVSLTDGQTSRAVGVLYAIKIIGARATWLDRAARDAGWELVVLGYTNARYGGVMTETLGLRPLRRGPQPMKGAA